MINKIEFNNQKFMTKGAIEVNKDRSIYRKGTTQPDKINHYHCSTNNRRKTVVEELRKTGNGYIYVG